MGFEKHAFSIRLPDKLRAEIDAIAEATDRSRAYVVKEAIEAYVEERRRYIAELEAAKAGALKGPNYSMKVVSAWLDSLGTANPLPKPEPDIFPGKE
jgi:predicted transcriptional regulator